MKKWRRFFQGRGPRVDAKGEFYPGRWEIENPVWLNAMGPVAATFMAARIMRLVAERGGTRVKPSTWERLEALAARALPEEVVPHCEAEAKAIVMWLEDPPQAEASQMESMTPELDMMVASDVESRLSVARFARQEGYGLELEYYDEGSGTWPRVRAVLEGIEEEDSDGEPALMLRDVEGEWSVALKFVRWLMPVALSEAEKRRPRAGAEVLDFPGRREED